MDYCEKCRKEVETKIKDITETYMIGGEYIDIDTQIMVCAECDEKIFNEDLDSATINKLFSKYRKEHKLDVC